MKSLKLLVIICCLFVSSYSNAQNQKLGHINTSDILKLMPDVKEAQNKLDKYSKELENQSESLVNEYQKKLDEFQNLPANTSETIKKDKQTELMQLEQRIKKFQEEAQGDVQKKQNELLEPIIKKVHEAIKDIAKDKGYSYIFDTSGGMVLYYEDTDDISSIVKQKLGLN